MTNFSETTKRVFEQYRELTENHESELTFDFDQEFYKKYNLPALHLFDGFYQGDATHEEITQIKDNLVSYENVADEGEEPEYEYDFDALDSQYAEDLEEYWLKYKKENWKELFENKIKDFLEENYPKDGENPGNDYSIWLDIESGEVFEMKQASGNWMFQEGRARVRITATENYDNFFDTVEDLIAEADNDTIAANLDVTLPENWEEFDSEEKIKYTLAIKL